MARANRVVIDNGVYHVTSRITNQAFLLESEKFKDKIQTWIYGLADFSGINVLAWCIMNNHFHLLLHVPKVPEKYWINQEKEPETSAFSMRPAECRAPRWMPDFDAKDGVTITSSGEVASQEAIDYSYREGVPLLQQPRPKTGFMLSDEEMIARLRRFEDGHSPRKVAHIEKLWKSLRAEGANDEVEQQKESYCRRMYNVSQYMKTLKQRITQIYNSETKHTGHLWSDRFYSGLVENELKAKIAVAAYIDWNAPRAKLVSHAKDWAWCSFGCAMGSGENAEKARRGYELVFGCSWNEARERMESIFSGKSVEEKSEEKPINKGVLKCRVSGEKVEDTRPKMTDLIKSKQCALNGNFISRDPNFGERIRDNLPKRFNVPSMGTLRFLERVNWNMSV